MRCKQFLFTFVSNIKNELPKNVRIKEKKMPIINSISIKSVQITVRRDVNAYGLYRRRSKLSEIAALTLELRRSCHYTSSLAQKSS